MQSNLIEKEISVHAPQHRVWRALTEGEHIGRWFGNGQPTRVDLRVGGMITPTELEARYRANDLGWNRALDELARYARELDAPA